MAPKLIVIIGITGNQGGSVAARFLQDSNYRVRGITRDETSSISLALASKGVELVNTNLDSVEELKEAFKGANLIFSVTNYWEPFFRPDCRAKAEEKGISCRKYAYDVELQQGKNIADAAASVANGLDENGFIASTLSFARESSKGRFQELYHFDSKSEAFPKYVVENWPDLEKKMSCIQTGYFMKSYQLVMSAYFAKLEDETFQMSLPMAPDTPTSHLAVNDDMGTFVYAVSKMRPGKSYMAEGTYCSWGEYMRTWTSITGKPTKYIEVTIDQFIANTPDSLFGAEIADMFVYSNDPGYDGGDKTLLKAEDIRKAGIDCPMTSLEDWMKKEDWSSVLTQ